MLPVSIQLEQGRLVCPLTRQRLEPKAGELVTPSGARYAIVGGVPILGGPRAEPHAHHQMADSSMYREYLEPETRLRAAARRLLHVKRDYRTPEATNAFLEVTERMLPLALCLSIGGGPGRAHPTLTNLNIDLFPNVDIVADAHSLPYADDAVDAIHCEAVLEHLREPALALREMKRVLAPGRRAYIATPFIQPCHGYPGHFRNYTLEGHDQEIESAGFRRIASGVCVGPTFALLDIVGSYLRFVLPHRRTARLLWAIFQISTKPLRRLDTYLNRSPGASILASSFFCLCEG